MMVGRQSVAPAYQQRRKKSAGMSISRDLPATSEVSEAFFADRIKSGDECIDTRKDENEDCWDGGDEGHKQAV
jgi:hypothetical protein